MTTRINFTRLLLEKQAEEGQRITLKEVVKKTGITHQTLHRLEIGETKAVFFETIDALRAYFGCDYNELFYDEAEGG